MYSMFEGGLYFSRCAVRLRDSAKVVDIDWPRGVADIGVPRAAVPYSASAGV